MAYYMPTKTFKRIESYGDILTHIDWAACDKTEKTVYMA